MRFPVVEDTDNTTNPRAEIRVWMLRNQLRVRDIAESLSINPSTVVNFLNGRTVSRRIRNYLGQLGCPEHLLEHATPKALPDHPCEGNGLREASNAPKPSVRMLERGKLGLR